MLRAIRGDTAKRTGDLEQAGVDAQRLDEFHQDGIAARDREHG